MTGADDDCSLGGAFERQIGRSCGIAHILGILLMNSCNTVIFLATSIICSLSTLNRVGHLNPILALGGREFERSHLQKFKCPGFVRGEGGWSFELIGALLLTLNRGQNSTNM